MATIDKSVRERVGPAAVKLVVDEMRGLLVEQPEVPYEVINIRIGSDGEPWADVRLAVTVSVPMNLQDRNQLTLEDHFEIIEEEEDNAVPPQTSDSEPVRS